MNREKILILLGILILVFSIVEIPLSKKVVSKKNVLEVNPITKPLIRRYSTSSLIAISLPLPVLYASFIIIARKKLKKYYKINLLLLGILLIFKIFPVVNFLILKF